jgi:hypothetical protein
MAGPSPAMMGKAGLKDSLFVNRLVRRTSTKNPDVSGAVV